MSRQYHFIFAALLIAGLLLTGCSSIYMPNVPATPMFKNKGEGYFAGHVNLKGNVSSTVAVSLADHIAVLGNGSIVKNGHNSNEYFRQWLAEGAIGYFTTTGKSNRQVLEIYGGYGIGTSRDIDQRASVHGYEAVESRVMEFDKIFLQVNYSSTRKRKISLFGDKRELNYGTAIRASRVSMRDFWINDSPVAKEENFFLEPVFFTRMELVSGLQLQYTTGFNIGLVNNSFLKAGNSIFTLGVTYNLGNKR